MVFCLLTYKENHDMFAKYIQDCDDYKKYI